MSVFVFITLYLICCTIILSMFIENDTQLPYAKMLLVTVFWPVVFAYGYIKAAMQLYNEIMHDDSE